MTDAEVIKTLAELPTQGAIAGVSVWLIEKLKQWPAFDFMDPYSDKVNRWVAVGVAALATIGISFTWDAQAGTLLIAGLTWSTASGLVWNTFIQFMMQQGVYLGTVKNKKKSPEEMIAAVPEKPPTVAERVEMKKEGL